MSDMKQDYLIRENQKLSCNSHPLKGSALVNSVSDL